MTDFEFHPDMDLTVQKLMHEELSSLAGLLNSLDIEGVRGAFTVVLYDDDGNVHTRHCSRIETEEDRSNLIVGLLDVASRVAREDI